MRTIRPITSIDHRTRENHELFIYTTAPCASYRMEDLGMWDEQGEKVIVIGAAREAMVLSKQPHQRRAVYHRMIAPGQAVSFTVPRETRVTVEVVSEFCDLVKNANWKRT